MKWLFGIIILVLLVVSARFRKFAGYFIVIGIVGGSLIWGFQEYEKNKSKSRISSAEVILRNISFEAINNNEYELTGRIVNNSEKYTLNGLQLRINAKDCANDGDTHCIVFTEKKEYIYITIPPGQARDFKKEINLYSDQNLENKLVWDYSIEYAESK